MYIYTGVRRVLVLSWLNIRPTSLNLSLLTEFGRLVTQDKMTDDCIFACCFPRSSPKDPIIQPDPDLKKEIQALKTQAGELFKAGDLKTISQVYTPDCHVMPPGMPVVVGREGVVKVLEGLKQMGVVEIRLTTEEVYNHGDSATEQGSYSFLAPEGVEADSGKYVVFLKKIEGRWMLHYDIFNTNKPPSP